MEEIQSILFVLRGGRLKEVEEIISTLKKIVVYYEPLKRALKTKSIYGYRCDERLKTNVGKSTRLSCTPLYAELEHLKIETRLTSEPLVS